MKISRVSLVVSIIALIIASAAWFRAAPAPVEDHYELAPAMGHLERYAEKLHFAGAAQNWELAAFYAHEVEEVAEEIMERAGFEDGHDIAALTRTMLAPAIEGVKAAVRQKDDTLFRSRYETLVQTCNACHATTDHGFIRMIVPAKPTYQSQDFYPR